MLFDGVKKKILSGLVMEFSCKKGIRFVQSYLNCQIPGKNNLKRKITLLQLRRGLHKNLQWLNEYQRKYVTFKVSLAQIERRNDAFLHHSTESIKEVLQKGSSLQLGHMHLILQLGTIRVLGTLHFP